VKPYADWLTEDYYIIQLRPRRRDCKGRARRREAPADDERMEILQSRRSYYPDDLVVIGWTAALIYDTPEGAQLIEFRYYDDMLTQVLADVYRSLDKGTGALARWRLAREAGCLNTIRLDVRELTERMDNSIKFLRDMYSASLPPGRGQGGGHGLPPAGGRKAAHGRRSVPVHDGPVPAGSIFWSKSAMRSRCNSSLFCKASSHSA
jgi:hypothetical protein